MSSGRTPYVCIVSLALVLGGIGCDSSSSGAPATAQQAPPPAPAPPAASPAPESDQNAAPSASAPADHWQAHAPELSDADIPPLPVVPYPAARPMEVVREAYVFAARHPEVLSHVPCFCGCESRGHKHNDDCFVTERDDKGRPTKWEPHGIG